MKKAAPALLVLVAVGAALAWWMQSRPSHRYTVVRGDTLSKIAQRYDVTVDELRAWNGIEGDLIEVGQVLAMRLPDGAEPAPAATPTVSKKRKRTRAARKSLKAERAPSGGSALPSPKPEPCVPFDPELGEEGMAAPEGLSHAQVKAALDAVIQHALACPPDPDTSRVDLEFELTVGCDGLVDGVTVVDGDGSSDVYTLCVAKVLHQADFPAHDIEGGMTFGYPVTVEW